jgi:NAD(P)-dependent dehydrogenase (short-subunit alcohol dehydrogenase family)
MAIDLTGQVALVTGGGAGIGKGIALGLARAGADIVIAEIDPQRAKETAELVQRAGRTALSVQTDVMDTGQVAQAIARAELEYGRIDILVNNAGGVRGAPFIEQSERSWRRHIDINLVSALAATSAAVPIMRRGRGGSIVNVSSIEGTRGAPMFAVYAACKAAMLSFTRTMALELAADGIRVNAITPDQTVTPGNHGQRTGPVDECTYLVRDPEMQDAMNRYTPLGREGVIAECGTAAAFLSSLLA